VAIGLVTITTTATEPVQTRGMKVGEGMEDVVRGIEAVVVGSDEVLMR